MIIEDNKIKIILHYVGVGLDMSIKFFKGGTFSNKHESEQLRRILPDIIDGLKIDDQDSYIFIDVQLGRSKIDSIVIKDDSIIIIEIKDKEGKIFSDLQNHKWIINYPEGVKEIYENGKCIIKEDDEVTKEYSKTPPSWQVIGFSHTVNNILNDKLDYLIRKYKKEPTETSSKVLNNVISSIIIFKENSKIKLKNYEEKHVSEYLSIISEDDNIAQKIIDEGSDYKFPDDICEIIKEVGHAPDEPDKDIRELNKNEVKTWLEIDLEQKEGPTEDESPQLEKKLKADLKSWDLKKVKEAIRTIEYSGWTQDYKETIFGLKESENPKIREIAFDNILEIETDPKKISDLVIEFLIDEDREIRIKALEAVMDYSITDAGQILKGWLDKIEFGPAYDIEDAKTEIKLSDKILSHEELKIIIDAVGILGVDNAVDSLITVIQEYREQNFYEKDKRRIISSTIETLGDIGSDEATDFLTDYLDERYFKDSAVLALAEIKGEKSSELIRNRFRDIIKDIKEKDQIENINNLSLYLGAVKKLEGNKGLEEIHELFELVYGQNHNVIRDILKVMKSKGSRKSFDVIFELFKKNPMYEHKILSTLYDLNKERYEDEIIDSLLKNIKNDDVDIAGKLLQYRIIEPTKRKNADKILKMLKNIKIKNPYRYLFLLEKISFLLLEYIEDHQGYYEEKKEEINRLLESENPEQIVIGIHIKAGVEKKDSLTTLEEYLNHEEDIVRRAVFDSILMEDIGSKEVLPFLFNNIDKLEKLDDEVIINFLSHMWYLRNCDIGKNYCMKNDISPPPNFLEDVIIEYNRFVNLEDIAFFWGEKSIPFIENIYDGIRDLWEEEHPLSAKDNSRYIMNSCKIIESEKTVPILEKIIEDTDQNGIYRETLNSDCKTLIKELDI